MTDARLDAANDLNTGLRELQQLAEKATPGEWKADGQEVLVANAFVWARVGPENAVIAESREEANAAFIAACSPSLLLALTEVAEALEEIRETAQWFAEEHAGPDLEVHHALKVEILDEAERALARLSVCFSGAQPNNEEGV